jgi:hypothetical protein
LTPVETGVESYAPFNYKSTCLVNAETGQVKMIPKPLLR